MLNLQIVAVVNASCCNGAQRYNDFLKLEKFSRFFLKSMVFPKRWGENDQHGEDFKVPHEH